MNELDILNELSNENKRAVQNVLITAGQEVYKAALKKLGQIKEKNGLDKVVIRDNDVFESEAEAERKRLADLEVEKLKRNRIIIISSIVLVIGLLAFYLLKKENIK